MRKRNRILWRGYQVTRNKCLLASSPTRENSVLLRRNETRRKLQSSLQDKMKIQNKKVEAKTVKQINKQPNKQTQCVPRNSFSSWEQEAEKCIFLIRFLLQYSASTFSWKGKYCIMHANSQGAAGLKQICLERQADGFAGRRRFINEGFYSMCSVRSYGWHAVGCARVHTHAHTQMYG